MTSELDVNIHADLHSTLAAAQVISTTCYTILGESREIEKGDVDQTRSRLLDVLEADLYAKLYLRPGPPRPVPPPAGDEERARRDLVVALSGANSGRGTWEPGWTVLRSEADGRVIATREGLAFHVDASDLRVEKGVIGPGVACRVRVGKERRNLTPGYYVALGDAEADTDDPPSACRYYWHLTAEAAPAFVREATSRLNAAGVPFLIKVLSQPAAYRRADAGVLYITRSDRRRAEEVLTRVHAAIAAILRPDVPLFTLGMAGGLAYAEKDSGESSFGEHRCRLVAHALWRSFAQGDASEAARAATLAAVLTQAGLDPARPHLEPLRGAGRPVQRIE